MPPPDPCELHLSPLDPFFWPHTPGLRLLPHVAADESSGMGGAASVGRCDARRDNRVLQHEGLSYLCHEASSRGAYMRSRADVSWCIRPFMLLV